MCRQPGVGPRLVNRIPRWRIAAALIIVAALVFFAALFTPIYVRNIELQNFVSDVAARPDTASRSDDLLRTWILDKAHTLKLPVQAGNIKIERSREGTRIDVRYFVRVSLPFYTVDLHFYPGAGSH